MDIFDAVFFFYFAFNKRYKPILFYQAKRKQALLESNLPGISCERRKSQLKRAF